MSGARRLSQARRVRGEGEVKGGDSHARDCGHPAADDGGKKEEEET